MNWPKSEPFAAVADVQEPGKHEQLLSLAVKDHPPMALSGGSWLSSLKVISARVKPR
jgi:hypothetical protein